MNCSIARILGITLALSFGLSSVGRSQGVPQGDLNKIVHDLAERVRHLGEDVASDMGGTPAGKHLIQDTQELAQAVDEFHETVHGNRDLRLNRQAYAGIDATWQHLRGQLSQGATPAVTRAANRVEQVNVQIRQILGTNVPPPLFYAANQAPNGIADTQRLGHALVARADALVASIEADMARDPNGPALTRDAIELVQVADRFHDSIDTNQPIEVAAMAFAPVDVIADRLELYITKNQVPPRVQASWQAFASVEVLIHQNLGLNVVQPNVQVNVIQQGGGPSPIIGLANQLDQQVDDFVTVFSQTAGNVPEGGILLAEAQRLHAVSGNFKQDAARNLPPNQLAYEFRDVDANWQRLARRVNRIAQGRVGPNIQQIQKISGTCEQIHRVLGMPGYAPVLNGRYFNR